jgi:hypothetical protein
MEQPATPIAFKVRTQGRYNGKKGGVIKAGGGAVQAPYGTSTRPSPSPHTKTNGYAFLT